MWAEKESLRRFLFIYVFSTFLLIGVSEYFYYLSFKKSMIEEEKRFIKRQFQFYLSKLKNKENISSIKKLIELKSLKIDITIYKNNTFMFGTEKPSYLFSDREFWVDNGKIYMLFILPYKNGKVYILLSKKINQEELKIFIKRLILLNVLILLFVFFVANYLGRLFLKPMKDTLKNLDEFIRDATHEMNTPLSVILGNLDLIALQIPSLGDTEEFQRIRSASNRLSKIFKDLSYIKIDFYKSRNPEPVSIKDILNNRIKEFMFKINNKKIKLNKDLTECIVHIDKEDAIRLIDNILSNAIKYSPINSVIDMQLKNCLLMISNSGEIIDTEKVKEMFVRENKNEGGFGLGLYIVKKICDHYGFKFQIYSSYGAVVVKIHFK